MKFFNSLIKLSLAGMVFLMSSPAMALISNSAHDFSGETWAVNSEICNVCHTPHNSDTSVALAPLWDHTLSTVSAYTVYSSSTLNASPDGNPTGITRLCLSCHDGTVALDAFGGAAGGTSMSSTIDAYLGTDLRDDHPVSFTYDDALASADGELFAPGSKPAAAALLFAGVVECASCHDVHNGTSLPSLLRVNNANSALCLTCHNK